MQANDLLNYEYFLFDCDGVILESNAIKTVGFKKIFKNFPSNSVKDFIVYHKANNGISRFEKINYFFLKYRNQNITNQELKYYSDYYGRIVFSLLCKAKTVKGIKKLLKFLILNKKKIFVVSGSYEAELKKVLEFQKLKKYFNEIYGSPRNKNQILNLIKKKHKINKSNTVFFGDSEIDYKTSMRFKIPFIHITRFTDNIFNNKNSEYILEDFSKINYK